MAAFHGPQHKGAMRERRARRAIHASRAAGGTLTLAGTTTRRRAECTHRLHGGHSDMTRQSQDRSCSVDQCARSDYYARGLCRFHYYRLYSRGTTDDPPPRVRRSCTVDGCDAPRAQGGLCQKHHCRVARHGSLDLPPRQSTTERFMAKVDKRPDGCWWWTATKNERGYGKFFVRKIGKRTFSSYAHRWSYEKFVGPIPDGLVIDHLCRNRACVNPDHLEPVTTLENLMRGEHPSFKAARTGVCKRGHSLGDAYIDTAGYRRCRHCRKPEVSS